MALTEAVNAANETDRALARMISRRIDIVFLWIAIARSPPSRAVSTAYSSIAADSEKHQY